MGRAVPEEKSRGRRTCRPPRAAMIRAGRIAARPGVCQLSTISVAPCITLPTCLLVLAVVLIYNRLWSRSCSKKKMSKQHVKNSMPVRHANTTYCNFDCDSIGDSDCDVDCDSDCVSV